MKVFAAVLLCVMMTTSVLVLLPKSAEAAPSDGWIAGVITDGTNPIDGAFVVSVLMMGGGGPFSSAWSDATGAYNLTVIGGLEYMVLAFHGDHLVTYGSTSVEPAETSTLDLVMTPLAPAVADVVIKGYLTDELGNPVTVGSVLGFVLDPMGEMGMPYYGNTTTPDGLGFYTVNVTASPAGGGVGAMDVPGYPFTSNETESPFVSGETYWINLTMSLATYADDATLHGIVTDRDTDLPIENAMVIYESWNETTDRGYSNFTFTDATGYYFINVTNGSWARVYITATDYSMFMVENMRVDPGEDVTIDAELVILTANIAGKVTDLSDDSPIANARVYLTDGYGTIAMANTNSTGDYELEAFAGTDLTLGAEMDGYSRNWTQMDVGVGANLSVDFGLWPVDAWLTGRVTDMLTGLPVLNAWLDFSSSIFNQWTDVNETGYYNVSLVSGDFTIRSSAPDYRENNTDLTVLPGGNVLDIHLIPWNIPATVRMYGWVNDSVSMSGIDGAQVQVSPTIIMPDGRLEISTNDTGYYEMMVAPLELFWLARAGSHEHVEGTVDATGLTELRMDFLLDADNWGPNVTYSQSPTANVSWTNPSIIDVVVDEADLEQMWLWSFLYNHSAAGNDYFYSLEALIDSFDPFSYSNDQLPFLQMGDTYTVNYAWDAMMLGGWLTNSTDDLYLASYEVFWGPDAYDAIRGYYSNATLYMEQGTCWFNRATSAFDFFTFDNGSLPFAMPSDSTGYVTPVVQMLSLNEATRDWNWWGQMSMGNWSVVGLEFHMDSVMPSGDYVTMFMASDFAHHMQINVTEMTVDNDLPVAVAGPWQQVMQNLSASFDGTGSSDNVGIWDYTWSFTDDVYRELYGPVVSYNFTTPGNHTVTLTVTDGAGHTASADTYVDVLPDLPPSADAGVDQTEMGGVVVWLDGSASSDDVQIVNWTWTFTYDGGEVILWGEDVNFTFWIEGVYDITLTVTDSAGQKSSDTVQVIVSGMIPEFPTLLLPISCLLGLVVLFRYRAVRRKG
ncbi:MAG: carboxypeptidase regulatory-like domain-containing protein [Thermoplasmata archaeon]|nr:carboxypeptidase regulatory-like domain-containing protein [Thermoplasmata archaeon]